MKMIQILFTVILTSLCLNSVSVASSGFADSSGGISIVPEHINIGDLAIVPMIAQVTTISIECSAPSAEPFYAEVDVSDFDGISELARLINEIPIKLKLKNPKDTISVKAYLLDERGDKLFYSYTSFNLTKVYDKDGNVSYQKPIWAISMHFSPMDRPLLFQNANSATLIDKYNNEEVELPIVDGQIILPGWTFYGNYQYLVIKTFGQDVEYIYDFKTGQRLDPKLFTASSEWVSISKVQHVPLEGDMLMIELQPENNWSPWIETNFGVGDISLDVESMWGVSPIAVWVTKLDDLRAGSKPKPISYYDGMVLKGTGTIYLYFEFPGWLYGANTGSGGGGKG